MGVPEGAELLRPVRSDRTRLIVWLGLVAFLAIGNAAWSGKFVASVLLGLAIGVSPWTAITSKHVTRGWGVFGWSVYSKRWKLSRFISIDTGSEDDDDVRDPTGMLMLMLFGAWSLLWPAFGRLFPWAGGPYCLSLRDYADEHITVWEGNREGDFQENLRILQEHANLPIGRR